MPDIQHAIQIAASPEAIYPLVGAGNGFREGWAADVTESSGEVVLGFFNRATVYRLKLKVDESPTYADWLCESGQEWGGTDIVFRLEGRPSGTLVRFAHAGWQAETDYFTSCNTTWGADVPVEGCCGRKVARSTVRRE
jgi:hypothetical protein